MSDTVISVIVTQVCALIVALGLGYWKFRAIEEKAEKASVAVTSAAATVATTGETVEKIAHTVATVKTQTDGTMTAMTELLTNAKKELKEAAEVIQQKSDRIEGLAVALEKARGANGSTTRRKDDPPA